MHFAIIMNMLVFSKKLQTCLIGVSKSLAAHTQRVVGIAISILSILRMI